MIHQHSLPRNSSNKDKAGSVLLWLPGGMHKPTSLIIKTRLFREINSRNGNSFTSRKGAITINRATSNNFTSTPTFRLLTCSQFSSSNLQPEFSNNLSDKRSSSSNKWVSNRLHQVVLQARHSTSNSTWNRAISKQRHKWSKQPFLRQPNPRQLPHL